MDKKYILLLISTISAIVLAILFSSYTSQDNIGYKILYAIATTGHTYIQGGDKILTLYFSTNDIYSLLFISFNLPQYLKNNFTVILKPIDMSDKSMLISCYENITYDQLLNILTNFTYAYEHSEDYVIKCFNSNQSKQYILNNYEIFVGTRMLGTPAYFIVFKDGNITAINETLKTVGVYVNPVVYNDRYIMLLYGYLPTNITERILSEIR